MIWPLDLQIAAPRGIAGSRQQYALSSAGIAAAKQCVDRKGVTGCLPIQQDRREFVVRIRYLDGDMGRLPPLAPHESDRGTIRVDQFPRLNRLAVKARGRHTEFEREPPTQVAVPDSCLTDAGDLFIRPWLTGTDGAYAARLRRTR